MKRRLSRQMAVGSFLVGMSLAGPQAIGIATADTGDAGSAGAPAGAASAAGPGRSAPAPAKRSARHGSDTARPAKAAGASRVAASIAVRVPPVAAVSERVSVTTGSSRAAARSALHPAPGVPGSGLPDLLSGALLMVRRAMPAQDSRASAAAGSVGVPALNPTQHVLLIGVDGTDLSKILADDYNQAFFNLMDTGTTAASTMVGHTTFSGPGWTGILTGVWSETAGVSNNVFTPWTYDTWPTVFNQLEQADPSIATTVIANWAVIAQIAGAGSHPADTIAYYPQIGTGWKPTDDAVGARSIQAIQGTVAGTPSLQMTYFVGIDNSGHDTYGAGSPEYAAELRNVNDNIAAIMAAVRTWETANPGEKWTVITVTDHGQVLDAPLSPLIGGLLAHGFQSPLETTPFIIADGPDFGDGVIDGTGSINNTYSQVDITPTILRLFGVGSLPSYFAGKPLMDKAGADYRPVAGGQAALKNALNDALGMYGYPDVATNLRLGLRTLAASVPYLVYSVISGLADPGDCTSFACVVLAADSLPKLLAVPVLLLGAVVYQLVNIPAQIIVRLTGVTGNQIVPPDLWPFLPVPGTQPVPPAPVLPTPVALSTA